jgi:hypothetical protein
VADAAPPRLTEHEAAAFRRDGLVLPRRTLEPALAARLFAAAEVAVRDAGPALAACCEIVGSGGADASEHPLVSCARAIRLDGLIEPLVGLGSLLWGCALWFAAQPDAAVVAWHQDDAPIGTVTVRIALDRVDRDNGCTRLLPRSHERLVREIRNARDRRHLALQPDGIDPAIVVEAVRERGGLTLYDGQTFRCEPANRSGRHRAAVVFRYAPAGSPSAAVRADPR